MPHPTRRNIVFPCSANASNLFGLRGRPEGIGVQRQGVQLFVAIAALDEEVLRIRQILEMREVPWYKAVEVGDSVAALIERCVTHEVANSASCSSPVRSR